MTTPNIETRLSTLETEFRAFVQENDRQHDDLYQRIEALGDDIRQRDHLIMEELTSLGGRVDEVRDSLGGRIDELGGEIRELNRKVDLLLADRL